jgi:lipopolysaccharide export system permease protein
MSLLSRYIFRQIMFPFVMVTVIITAVAWLTQATKLLDLIILQGQGAGIFFRLTLLFIPSLAGLIAPVGLLIASIYTLNRMNQDSEIAVIYAAGSGKWQIVRPFLLASLLVTLIVIAINTYIMPKSLQALRAEISQIRADIVANLLQPGRFFSPTKGVTIYFRERNKNNDMLGVLIHDKRNRAEQVTIVAQRSALVSNKSGNFMVFFNGSIQRKSPSEENVNLVAFTQYSYDLSELSPESKISFLKPKEKFISDLYNPDPLDPYYRGWPEKVRSELHRRLISIIYPLVFTLISLAFLANAQTARQGQIIRILLAIFSVALVRGLGLALTNLSGKKDWAVLLVYGLPIMVIIISLYAINMNKVRPFWRSKHTQRPPVGAVGIRQ